MTSGFIYRKVTQTVDSVVWLRQKQVDQVEAMKIDCIFSNCGREAKVAWQSSRFGEAPIFKFKFNLNLIFYYFG